VIILFNFFLIHATPGDPVNFFIGEGASEEYIVRVRAAYGLDKSLPEQLYVYLLNVFRGDLGSSIMMNVPVLNLILERLPYTLLLGTAGLFFAIIIGIPLGILAAKKKYSTADNVSTTLALIGYSVPSFWLGIMLILLFSLTLHWLPSSGFRTLGVKLTGFPWIIDVLRHMIMPTITTGLYNLALIIGLTRSSMLDALQQDYIRFARAKGLKERTVTYKHALRNALLPVTTIVGLRIGVMFSGAIVAESVFGWPGIGQLLLMAVLRRDYPVVLGVFTITSIAAILICLITDLVYCLLDPRIAYGTKV
jgi:peptide/nickel transport system permease protein